MKLILEAIKSLFRKIEAQRTHYDTRGFVDTQANTIEGTTVEWGYIKVADRIDFDFTQVTAISIKVAAIDGGEELTQEITDLPVSVENDFGNALGLVSYTDEWDDYYWAVYLPDQESADIWAGEEDHPFTPGLYIWTGIEDKATAQTVTYSFTLAVGELKRLDEKYLPESVFEKIEEAQATADSKTDKKNPVGTGSFSMNRRIDTPVGNYSTAMGRNTKASGDCSTAMGFNTAADNDCSTAMGLGTTASGVGSTAMGNTTTAQRKSQHVQGEFNLLDTYGSTLTRGKYAHIVGNGTSNTKRSNAHTLDWNGLGWFAGGLKVGGTSQDDTSAKEVATKDDKLPNPNALTFSGAVTGTYDGSAPLTVEIPSDSHINNLINTALGVIENGTY